MLRARSAFWPILFLGRCEASVVCRCPNGCSVLRSRRLSPVERQLKIHAINAVFVHIPRCGGTTVNNTIVAHGLIPGHNQPLRYPDQNHHILYGHLNINGQVLELDHCFAEHIRRYFCSPYENETFTFFAFLRNPVDRIVSVYRAARQMNNFRILRDSSVRSFTEFVDGLETLKSKGYFDADMKMKIPHNELSHYVPQSHYVLDRDGKSLVDVLKNVSDLESTLGELLSSRGVNVSRIMRANASSPSTTVAEEEIEKNRLRIRELYASDYDLGIRYPES